MTSFINTFFPLHIGMRVKNNSVLSRHICKFWIKEKKNTPQPYINVIHMILHFYPYNYFIKYAK